MRSYYRALLSHIYHQFLIIGVILMQISQMVFVFFTRVSPKQAVYSLELVE